MLLGFLVYWNIVLTFAALVANLTALCALLGAWSAFYQRDRRAERLGYFVFLTAVFADLGFVVLVRVPVIHADINGEGFLFGDGVCKATQVLDVALSNYQERIEPPEMPELRQRSIWRITLFTSLRMTCGNSISVLSEVHSVLLLPRGRLAPHQAPHQQLRARHQRLPDQGRSRSHILRRVRQPRPRPGALFQVRRRRRLPAGDDIQGDGDGDP